MRRTTIMSRRDMTTGTVGAWIGVDVACSSSAIVRVIVSLRPKPRRRSRKSFLFARRRDRRSRRNGQQCGKDTSRD